MTFHTDSNPTIRFLPHSSALLHLHLLLLRRRGLGSFKQAPDPNDKRAHPRRPTQTTNDGASPRNITHLTKADAISKEDSERDEAREPEQHRDALDGKQAVAARRRRSQVRELELHDDERDQRHE